jgi:hypothetical protein
LRAWYEIKFSLDFRSKLGVEFQEFFSSIMERRYPSDFQKVKPYGKAGDRKCDGYRELVRSVYQVYAPEKMKVSETNAKIEEDFSEAYEYWKTKMEKWVFVHNQWRGIPADVLNKLLEIHGRNGVGVLRWCETELRSEFFELSEADQALLLGPAPSAQTFAHIQLKDVIEVVNAIAQQAVPPPEAIREVPAGKLKANSLSDHVQTLLKMGSRKANLVKSFFAQWYDPELGDRVAKTFREKYESLRDAGVLGDDNFVELWHFARTGVKKSMHHEAAVLAVLAFLFEECEIFEEPPIGAPN